MVISSKGPYPQVSGENAQAWEGVVQSAEVHVLVNEPAGNDLEAFNAYRGQPLSNPNLLKDFPTSTYAGYVVYEKYAGSIPGARYPNTAAVGEDARKYALTLVAPRPEDKVYKAPDKAIRENIAMI